MADLHCARAAQYVVCSDEVRARLAADAAVVALESTVISHGLPWPHNLEVALGMEAAVRAAGATPATIAVLDGKVRVGLDSCALTRLAKARDVIKASSRDLSFIIAKGANGATTVAGTLACAQLAGIRIMATGGIGGVHRGVMETADVSADINALARYPLTVIASGAKSILDLPRTLEYLESAGVSVVGYKTDRFPAFYCADSGLALSLRVDDAADAARLSVVNWALNAGGVLIANPVPVEAELAKADVEQWVEQALLAAQSQGMEGKAVTPFLLTALAQSSAGATLAANKALLLCNASLAGAIAARLASAEAL